MNRRPSRRLAAAVLCAALAWAVPALAIDARVARLRVSGSRVVAVVELRDLLRDRFLLGSPDEVAEAILTLHRATGINHLIMSVQWPGMPQSLVLDELHTYRGRQGSDVALLVRRVREACEAPRLQCVGTSATLAGAPTIAMQKEEIGRVATVVFTTPDANPFLSMPMAIVLERFISRGILIGAVKG